MSAAPSDELATWVQLVIGDQLLPAATQTAEAIVALMAGSWDEGVVDCAEAHLLAQISEATVDVLAAKSLTGPQMASVALGVCESIVPHFRKRVAQLRVSFGDNRQAGRA